MFNKDKKEEIVLDYNIEKVKDAVIKAADKISSFKLRKIDETTHKIIIAVRLSFTTWGELMSVILNDLGEDKTQVIIESKSNLGTEIGASKKNLKNIEILIEEMKNCLANI